MTPSESYEIRESYRALPFQGFWTWLTGKELRDRLDHRPTPPWMILAEAWLLLLTGLGGSFLAYQYCIWLLPLFWIFTTGGMRHFVATVGHMCVHGFLFRAAASNKLVAEVIGITLFVQGYAAYRQDHMLSHHGHNFGTEHDRDGKAICLLGFEPGKSVPQLWCNLLWLLVSPTFHWAFWVARFKENFLTASRLRTGAALLWWSVVGYAGYRFGYGLLLALYLLPVLVLYQISSLLQLVTEHIWLGRQPGDSTKETHHKLSLGRFCGSRAPGRLRSLGDFAKWGVWLAAQFGYHLPVRVFILQGTFPAHDWHHRHGGSRAWANVTREREKDILRGDAEIAYQDHWGMINIYNAVFTELSRMDKPVLLHIGELRLN